MPPLALCALLSDGYNVTSTGYTSTRPRKSSLGFIGKKAKSNKHDRKPRDLPLSALLSCELEAVLNYI